jgi:cytochrome c-type biogenesis protein
VLPLVPGYLSYVTGLSAAEVFDEAARRRGRLVAGALLFVAGFTFVFVSAGVLLGGFGGFLIENQVVLQRVLGSLTIVLGLAFIGGLPWLQRDLRVHSRPAVGLAGAPVLGMLFGLGWTPCIGPTLGAVMALGIDSGTAARGGVLAVAYCLGLGLPFVVTALAFGRAMSMFGWVKRHQVAVMRAGGLMLVTIGILLVTGAWNDLTIAMQVWVNGFTPAV